MNQALRLTSLGLVLATATACTPTLDLDIKLVTTSCDPDVRFNPMKDDASAVTQFRFAVTGEGVDPTSFQKVMNTSDGTLTLPEIPIGPDINLRVDALLPSGAILASGQTGPMDLTDRKDALPVTIFLRRTNAFTPTTGSASQTTCTKLTKPRAAHTATVLNDGRVLFVGGYYEQDGTRTYTSSTEIYDPRTGEFTAGPSLRQGRAHHTATKLPGTPYTLIAGGEYPSGANPNEPLVTAEIYDEARNEFVLLQMKKARSRHAAAVPTEGGVVVLVGGYGKDGILSSIETFDIRKVGQAGGPFAENVDGDLFMRAEASAIGLPGGRILIAGGIAGTNVLDATTLLKATEAGTYKVVDTWAAKLSVARAKPLLAALDENTILVSGGFTQAPPQSQRLNAKDATATDATDVIRIVNGAGTATAQPDLHLSEASGYGGMVSLGDGRVLAGGGSSKTATGVTTAPLITDLIYAEDAEVASRTPNIATLRRARYQSTWTLLQDGTVLVAGGIDLVPEPTFLDSLEVFQPGPR